MGHIEGLHVFHFLSACVTLCVFLLHNPLWNIKHIRNKEMLEILQCTRDSCTHTRTAIKWVIPCTNTIHSILKSLFSVHMCTHKWWHIVLYIVYHTHAYLAFVSVAHTLTFNFPFLNSSSFAWSSCSCDGVCTCVGEPRTAALLN